jgi:hypothetical protein
VAAAPVRSLLRNLNLDLAIIRKGEVLMVALMNAALLLNAQSRQNTQWSIHYQKEAGNL